MLKRDKIKNLPKYHGCKNSNLTNGFITICLVRNFPTGKMFGQTLSASGPVHCSGFDWDNPNPEC